MKLATISRGRSTGVAVIQGEAVVDLAELAKSGLAPQSVSPDMLGSMAIFLQQGRDVHAALAEAAHLAADNGVGVSAIADCTFAPPVPTPQKIIGVGMNYSDHCAEIGRPVPDSIQTFAMFANTLVGHKGEVILPRHSEKMDWEAELVIVIGKQGKYISEESAMSHIAGFTIGNDISARDFQFADKQTTRGKSGDTHSPLGPWIVTPDEIGDGTGLDISLSVNGVTKQSSNTDNLVFGPREIVAFLSGYFTMQPGDLIFTGTPGGVGLGRNPQEWLKPGDDIEISIAGIGTLQSTCRAETTA